MNSIKSKWGIKKWLNRSLRLALALSIGFTICQFDLDYFEYLTYDLRYQLKPTSPTSGKIVTISIDTLTLKELGREPVATDHTKLIEVLGKSQALNIIFVFDEDQIVGEPPELLSFAQKASKLPLYFAVNDLFYQGMESEYKMKPPLDQIKILSGPRTFDSKIFAKDGVTRRMILDYQGGLTMHPQLAAQFTGFNKASEYNGVFEFLDSKQALIDFRPSGTYKPLSYSKILKGEFNPRQLEGKIVVVGRDTLASSNDYITTPFSREINAMSITEMHANMLDTLILNNSPQTSPNWLDLLITCLISVLTIYVVLTVRPGSGLIVLLITLSSLILLSVLLMVTSQFVIALSHPLLALFVCYYFFIPYRLIMENRKSWEYYHKNKLLTQVEELKSNFLKMMSHDLKTPLARIQGMTDVVMRERKDLSPTQVDAVKTISKSSEELTEFIGSILSLGRIESKEIKLQAKSKDINALVKETVKKCEYLAKEKSIEILTELEPLFSISIDEDLMKQVFTNLVENAIKYSPENSKVLVSTEEVDGRIVVQVADQGIGILKSEHDNVFSKFYRSNNVNNGPIKGSGLGLYLSNYFVELHSGKILLESEPNKGSTFTVELPMDV